MTDDELNELRAATHNPWVQLLCGELGIARKRLARRDRVVEAAREVNLYIDNEELHAAIEALDAEEEE